MRTEAPDFKAEIRGFVFLGSALGQNLHALARCKPCCSYRASSKIQVQVVPPSFGGSTFSHVLAPYRRATAEDRCHWFRPSRLDSPACSAAARGSRSRCSDPGPCRVAAVPLCAGRPVASTLEIALANPCSLAVCLWVGAPAADRFPQASSRSSARRG